MRNGEVSHWYAATGRPAPRPPLPGDRTADVCIVGAGFTGLWTAYYLKQAQPGLDVVVVERAFAGFGASGRNGGWLTSEFAAVRRKVAAAHGRDAVIALQRAMHATVDEVIAACDREAIDADIRRGGMLRVARGEAQLRRMRVELAADREWGRGHEEVVELSAEELAGRLRINRAGGALFEPQGARVQPAKLVRGLAAAVERLGVPIFEQTTVERTLPDRVLTDRGTITAPTTLLCLEGFLADLRGHRRDRVPLNSAMVATAPLSPELWDEIGWEGCELFGDGAHAYIYAQRTSDGRIALGGRGVPYRYGSRTDVDGRTQRRTAAQLTRLLHELFPAVAAVPIEHAWCGVLGVPRDWTPTVRLDRGSGIGIAGGYVGSGVATSNLAGRTMRDLVLGEQTELTRLPWVGHLSRRWEPEPLRFIGAHLVYSLYRAADRREAGGLPRTSRLARAADLLAGR